MNFIKIRGAKEHNLKNIDVDMPRNKMVVLTGVSGSGKSSLAFDTIFAEGQRRYMESLSAYARQFLEKMDKPDVEEIQGLSPSISIDQKSHSSNPRSTVATITEIYDYLRVLFARAGTPYCPICKRKIQKLSPTQIVDEIISEAKTKKDKKEFFILSPIVRGRKGEYYQLLYDFLSKGFTRAIIDGKERSLRERIILERYKEHNIDIVVDSFSPETDFRKKENRLRLAEAVEVALNYGDESLKFQKGNKVKIFSARFSCPYDGFSFPEIEPRLFSFNSPYGACPTCHGLGRMFFGSNIPCSDCGGKRLKKEALSISIEDKNIDDTVKMAVEESWAFFEYLGEKMKSEIVSAPLREIKNRLKFLMEVGLNYLTLDRMAGTLSGGEAQRIRLASQIGSQLTGTLYVLDEPTIGLHQRDNEQLIKTLEKLRDMENSVLIVEHDTQTILSCDYMVDIGPGPGIHGGEIVASGKLPELLKDRNQRSLTLDYLRGKKKIATPSRRKVEPSQDFLRVKGITHNNIKGMDIKIPLRRFNLLTGVSGSGKSSFMVDVLYRALIDKLYFNEKNSRVRDIKGEEYIGRVINIDQSPIGRSSRSNPVTYIGAWDDIRDLFASTEEARKRGYKKGRFSFNVKGGRCENCQGHGYIAIEMHFLPTVYTTCEVCKGGRYNRETLEVKYKGKNIYNILEMTVEEARKFFSDIPSLRNKLSVLMETGLSYLKLGQPSPTLSGGEAQRIKIAKELSKPNNRRTLYLLDEPTTGLHFDDIKKLVEILQRLVDKGNTTMVIEHNLDVIKCADWVIDLGPEGGDGGGKVVVAGTPETVAKTKESHTGRFLKEVL